MEFKITIWARKIDRVKKFYLNRQTWVEYYNNENSDKAIKWNSTNFETIIR